MKVKVVSCREGMNYRHLIGKTVFVEKRYDPLYIKNSERLTEQFHAWELKTNDGTAILCRDVVPDGTLDEIRETAYDLRDNKLGTPSDCCDEEGAFTAGFECARAIFEKREEERKQSLVRGMKKI